MGGSIHALYSFHGVGTLPMLVLMLANQVMPIIHSESTGILHV